MNKATKHIRSMKCILSFLMFCLCISFLSVSCNSTDAVETDAELIPYFEIFAEEAAKRGFAVDYEAERIEGLIQDITDSNIQGQCFHNQKKPKKVIIDVEYWEDASPFEKEFIIFHELGHCFLDRDHLDAVENGVCVSIMHSSEDTCPFDLNDDNREAYLDELFSN